MFSFLAAVVFVFGVDTSDFTDFVGVSGPR
jgi:hypothetical protein